MESNNPLAGHFRIANVQQTLPTAGQFFAKGEIDTAMNGEVAVFPMTAKDEIVLKNPDALLNGDALENLFRSCVPAIKAPRKISVPDMDVLLLAIKLASYGDALEVNVTCPECKHEFTTDTSIRGLLGAAETIKAEDTVIRVSDDLVIRVRPYNFEDKTKLDLTTFEESKMFQYLLDTDMSEEDKQKRFNVAFERIAELNLDLLGNCVETVTVPTGEVTNKKHIQEFIKNTDRGTIKKITEKLKLLSESGIPKEIEVKCANEKCGHEWKTAMVFDPSHFFA